MNISVYLGDNLRTGQRIRKELDGFSGDYESTVALKSYFHRSDNKCLHLSSYLTLNSTRWPISNAWRRKFYFRFGSWLLEDSMSSNKAGGVSPKCQKVSAIISPLTSGRLTYQIAIHWFICVRFIGRPIHSALCYIKAKRFVNYIHMREAQVSERKRNSIQK